MDKIAIRFRMLPCLICLVWLGSAATARADGTLTEQNMTQHDFETLTRLGVVTREGSDAPLDVPHPIAIHNLSHQSEQALKDAHGAKLIKGKDWKALTPTERSEQLLRLKETLEDPNRLLVIEIPSGNVWVIPENHWDLYNHGDLRPWLPEEVAALPVSVRKNPRREHRDSGPKHDAEGAPV